MQGAADVGSGDWLGCGQSTEIKSMTIINGQPMDDGVDEPTINCPDCGWPADQCDCGEPVKDNPGYKPCTCEDYPCCGH